MTRTREKELPKPPKLLLGTSLMVWGAFSAHALIALGAALLVESRHWLNWRWDFGEKGYVRAWVLSLVGLTLSIGWHALNGSRPDALLDFVRWLPVAFLPLILAQQYGVAQAIPTTVFSALARRRQKKAVAMGRTERVNRIHFGYPYFLMVLLSIGHDNAIGGAQRRFFIAFIVLIAIAFYYVNRKGLRRRLSWLLAILCTAALTYVGSTSILRLYSWFQKNGLRAPHQSVDDSERRTQLGEIGEIKPDRRIHWRYYPGSSGKPAERVMVTSFNTFYGDAWVVTNPEGKGSGEKGFDDMSTSVEEKDRGEFAYATEYFTLNEAKIDGPRLRGRIRKNREAIPALEDLALISSAEEIDGIETNLLGTMMAINAASAIDYTMWPAPAENPREQSPRQSLSSSGNPTEHSPELDYPQSERAALISTINKLGLRNVDDQEKIRRLREYFSTFRYTLDRTIQGRNPLSQFLTQTKAGHCEYFASATTLILRELGIPTRYVIGYAVREKGKAGEYLLRGSHSHSWCRAYLGGEKITELQNVFVENRDDSIEIEREVWQGGEWVDVDLTPPDWFAMDSPPPSTQEKLLDELQRWREDFQIWRDLEGNKGWVNAFLVIAAVGVAGFLFWRLQGSRMRADAGRGYASYPVDEDELTPLNEALKALERKVGARPPGVLPGAWLRNLGPRPEHESEINRAIELHNQSRFGGHALADAERAELSRLAEVIPDSYSQVEEK
ncbi:MAG: transglutaminase domain-containing protein [Verrucomicrobiota bacterium JB023]|nr:transglutaminase domain-containing protein [Verrucomicrobiota bacterium JB023]